MHPDKYTDTAVNQKTALVNKNVPRPAMFPVMAVKQYVDVATSWWVTGQMFVYCGGNLKGPPMYSEKLAH